MEGGGGGGGGSGDASPVKSTRAAVGAAPAAIAATVESRVRMRRQPLRPRAGRQLAPAPREARPLVREEAPGLRRVAASGCVALGRAGRWPLTGMRRRRIAGLVCATTCAADDGGCAGAVPETDAVAAACSRVRQLCAARGAHDTARRSSA
eukprot:scaffold4370_cov317-Prasinococcus_capsulatus_cf.AAC.11